VGASYAPAVFLCGRDESGVCQERTHPTHVFGFELLPIVKMSIMSPYQYLSPRLGRFC